MKKIINENDRKYHLATYVKRDVYNKVIVLAEDNQESMSFIVKQIILDYFESNKL